MSSRRVLYALDSQVSLGCLVKGRASSSALNRELKRRLPYPVGADLTGHFLSIQGQQSRWPDSFAAMDLWIAKVESKLAPEPFDSALLGKKSAVSLASGRAVRTKAFRQTRAKKLVSSPRNVPKVQTCAEESAESATTISGLPHRALELLRALPKRQVFFQEGIHDFLEPGALDLFSGGFGVARAMIKLGAPWVLTFEWNRSAGEDLLSSSARNVIIELMSLKAVKVCGAAPICSSFSISVTPAVRSSEFPLGIPSLKGKMKQKVLEGNSHNDFLIKLFNLCEKLGVGVWIENPDTSWWWRQKNFRAYRSPDSPDICRLCFCRFGTPWKESAPTSLYSEDCGFGVIVAAITSSSGENSTLRKKPWSFVAQPYPRGVSFLSSLRCLCFFRVVRIC